MGLQPYSERNIIWAGENTGASHETHTCASHKTHTHAYNAHTVGDSWTAVFVRESPSASAVLLPLHLALIV